MRYLVVIERGSTSLGAYYPDLPGCIAVSETRAETERLIAEAIGFSVEGLRANGELIRVPACTAIEIEVPPPA
jgi:predicted RNase H-like HicB family nuclease